MNTHVSVSNKTEAQANIQRKLDTLKRWILNGFPYLRDASGALVRDGNGDAILDFYPTSILALSKWDGSQNCAFVRTAEQLAFRSFSRDTVSRTREGSHWSDVNALLQVVTKRAKSQATESKNSELIKKLLQDRATLTSLVQIQEQEIQDMRTSAYILQESFATLTGTRERNEAELCAQISAKDARIAELTALLGKVTSLKSLE